MIIRKQEMNKGDEVHWVSGGTWDGIIIDMRKNVTTHDLLLNAIDGRRFWLKNVEYYGIKKGRSKFVEAEGYIREGNRYVKGTYKVVDSQSDTVYSRHTTLEQAVKEQGERGGDAIIVPIDSLFMCGCSGGSWDTSVP